MKPLAIVIPWFGADQTGGAEQQAFQIAARLTKRGHLVEVLTTTCLSFNSDWSMDHFAAGVVEENGVTVRRFPVDKRDTQAFDAVNAKLLGLRNSTLRRGVTPVSSSDETAFVHENVKSAALIDYLRAERASYKAFLFLPYMFSTSILGVPIVADRAWLQPCLHDEPQAYFAATAAMFRRANKILFNSEGERLLALQLYGPGIYSRSIVVGEGVEPEANNLPKNVSALPDKLTGLDFVLYLGRRDRSKNVDLLVEAFKKFKAHKPESTLELVLAGPGLESFGTSEGVHDLGCVSNEQKSALLANCRALVQPSRNESFSRTMMEAWAVAKPVVVNGECIATSLAVKESGGGWRATTEAQWFDVLGEIENASDEDLNNLGERGRVYFEKNADWGVVIDRYENLLLATDSESSLARSQKNGMAIHQLLPDIVYGDAISNQARAIRDYLRGQGYVSDIFVKRREERISTEALLFDETQPEPADALLYHHAIGSELTEFAIRHQGSKCLIYHNITPADYFAPYRPGFAWMLEVGRANLKHLARHFTISVGDSSYNAQELTANGFPNPGVLPIIINPDVWNVAPDERLMTRLQDGCTNILFVGRVAPNKKQQRLVEAFAHYRELDSTARLTIAGETRESDPYFHHLLATRKRLGLEGCVEISGQISEAQLLAYFQTAHLYWSPSEHEGFGAPLVEAMWFDVPVLALSATAVPETMDTAGMLYSEDEELPEVAWRAFQLTHDQTLRDGVLERQRVRRLDFRLEAIQPILEELIQKLTTQPALALS